MFTVSSLRRMLPPAQAAPAKKGELVALLVTLQLFRQKSSPIPVLKKKERHTDNIHIEKKRPEASVKQADL